MAHKINPSEYIHFEADQVLTNDYLNQQFIYLDQQDRWTRNKLLGTGITCGLDICFNVANSSVTITKGSGITSQGYLILFPETKIYTYYSKYNPVKQPHDLPFECSSAATKKYIPFYKEYNSDADIAAKLKDDPIYVLGNDKTPTEDAILLSDPKAVKLSKYAVVLFLQLDENDMRSCTTESCNNKGAKMVFKVVPLLVPTSLLNCTSTISKPKEIRLTRYNVPYEPICGSQNVLDAFSRIIRSGVIEEIADAYCYCFQAYRSYMEGCCTQKKSIKEVGLNSEWRATCAKDIAGKLKEIMVVKDGGVAVQYFYDFIDDLILAYYELREVTSMASLSQCLSDECAFPLHLVLGVADKTTCNFTKVPCRAYFTPTPILENKNATGERIRFLLNRMQIMILAFDRSLIVVKADESMKTLDSKIKITPSQYRDFRLSERCIPYYYNPAPVASFDGNAINYWWDYDKTKAGNENFNLGYHAAHYNGDPSITDPLLYDIERYNFFKMEGHIGQNYEKVFKEIFNQRERYNLPFDVVAIPAECLNTSNAVLPKCNFLDLESEFRLLVLELLINYILCFRSLKKYAGNYYTGDIAKSEKSAASAAVADDLEVNALKDTLLLRFSNYKHGDFVKDFDLSDPVTERYLKAINSKGELNNPFSFGSGDATKIPAEYLLNNPLFELLHAIDVMYHSLLNTNISDLKPDTFKTQYENVTAQKSNYLNQISSIAASGNIVSARSNKKMEMAQDTPYPAFEDCCCDSMVALAAGIMLVMEEYLKRLKYYQSQLTFLNYFRKHPGLEHKAGVPKGGTFVLVYNTDTREKEKHASELDAYVTKVKNIKKDAPSSTIVEMLNSYCKVIGPGSSGGKSPDPAQPISVSIPTNIVIADFYVPYLCCSDCAPVAYIFDNKPVAYNVSGGGAVCSNSITGLPINLSGSDSGLSYQLYSNNQPVSSVPAQIGTGGPLVFISPVPVVSATYSIVAATADGNDKNNMPGSAVVTVNQVPSASGAAVSPPVVCVSGEDTSQIVSLSGTLGGSATSGKWSTNGKGTITQNDPTPSATYQITAEDINQIEQKGSGIITFTLTPISPDNNCPAETSSASLTIIQGPTVTDISVSPPVVCIGSKQDVFPSVALSGTFGSGASSGTWSMTNGNGKLTQNTSGSTAKYQISAKDTGETTFTLTPANPESSCPGIPRSISLTVNRAPKIKWKNAAGGFVNGPATINADLTTNLKSDTDDGTWKIRTQTPGDAKSKLPVLKLKPPTTGPTVTVLGIHAGTAEIEYIVPGSGCTAVISVSVVNKK